MRLSAFPAAFALAVLAFAPARLAAADAQSYLESASLFGSGAVIVARLEMRITRSGSELSRELELSLDRSGAGVKSLARIVKPAFLSGMNFLKLSSPGKPDAQWLKTSRGLRRLGDANRSEAVFDSDFTAEDFGSVSAAGFDFAFAPARDLGGARAIEARPKGAAPYALRVLYVDDATRILTGMDYLDGAGKITKRYRVMSIDGQGETARPASALMENLSTGSSTRLAVLSLSKPAFLPERTFNPGSL